MLAGAVMDRWAGKGAAGLLGGIEGGSAERIEEMGVWNEPCAVWLLMGRFGWQRSLIRRHVAGWEDTVIIFPCTGLPGYLTPSQGLLHYHPAAPWHSNPA